MKTKLKSLTPIIATILLVVISVIFVITVLSWGKGFATQGLDESNTVLKETSKNYLIGSPKLNALGIFTFKNITPGNEPITITGYKIISSSEDSNFNIIIDLNETTISSGATQMISIPAFPPEDRITIQLITDQNEYISVRNINNIPEEQQDIYVPEPCSIIPENGEIYYLEHLAYIDTNMDTSNGHYILQRDLNFLDDDSYCEPETYKTTWITGTGWDPIGDYTFTNRFNGTFDGNNHTISNLYINRPTTDYVGFFGYVYGGISNLNLEDVNVIGKNYVGSLVGYSDTGDISHCVSNGDIIGYDSVGCFVGHSIISLPTDCNFTGNYNCTKTPSCYEGCPIGYYFD